MENTKNLIIGLLIVVLFMVVTALNTKIGNLEDRLERLMVEETLPEYTLGDQISSKQTMHTKALKNLDSLEEEIMVKLEVYINTLPESNQHKLISCSQQLDTIRLEEVKVVADKYCFSNDSLVLGNPPGINTGLNKEINILTNTLVFGGIEYKTQQGEVFAKNKRGKWKSLNKPAITGGFVAKATHNLSERNWQQLNEYGQALAVR